MNKSLVRVASILFPKQITSFAYQKLTNPQVYKLRENEIEILDQAQKEILRFYDFDIQLYTWKGGEKEILLIHGWEGQAGNFSDIIKALLADGFTVHAFDGPSHGFSSKGRTSIIEFTELVAVLIQKYKVENLLSHSFGGVAATVALSRNPQIKIKRYVLFTTPDRFQERIDEVSNTIGITDTVKERLIGQLETQTKMKVEDINVSNFVRAVQVEKALILHDKNDRVIPFKIAENVNRNWPASELKAVEGSGHFRILRTPSIIREAIDFLNQ